MNSLVLSFLLFLACGFYIYTHHKDDVLFTLRIPGEYKLSYSVKSERYVLCEDENGNMYVATLRRTAPEGETIYVTQDGITAYTKVLERVYAHSGKEVKIAQCNLN